MNLLLESLLLHQPNNGLIIRYDIKHENRLLRWWRRARQHPLQSTSTYKTVVEIIGGKQMRAGGLMRAKLSLFWQHNGFWMDFFIFWPKPQTLMWCEKTKTPNEPQTIINNQYIYIYIFRRIFDQILTSRQCYWIFINEFRLRQKTLLSDVFFGTKLVPVDLFKCAAAAAPIAQQRRTTI